MFCGLCCANPETSTDKNLENLGIVQEEDTMEKANLIGAATGIFLYCLYIVMFTLRLLGLAKLGHWIASLQFLCMFPLVYLLVIRPRMGDSPLLTVQIVLMIAFLIIEFFLDYLLKFDFRQTRWMVITYVTFFFAATGGLLGIIARMEDKIWILVGGVLFLIMAVLAFAARAVTGI